MSRFLIGLVAAAPLVLLITVVPVGAETGPNQGQVRLVYVSPNGGNVDFYVDGQKALSDTNYKTVSRYLPFAAGRHTFAVRQAGSAPDSTMMAQADSQVDAAGYYTVTVGGKAGQLKAVVFADAFNPPGSGQFQARFVHTAPEVPGVDVALKGGRVLFTNIAFLQASPYGTLPGGSYDLELRATGTDQVLFSANSVAVAAGVIESMTAVGGVGQPIELMQIMDATAAGTTPQGGANTGGGGLAARQAVLLGAFLAFLLVGPALVALARRRQRLI